MENTELAQVVTDDYARVNITWSGQNGDMLDPVNFNASDSEIREWATEAVRSGTVPGIEADSGVDFSDFVVDRFRSTSDRPYNVLMLRAKTPFGI